MGRFTGTDVTELGAAVNCGPYTSRKGPAVSGCAGSPVCWNRKRMTLIRIGPPTEPERTRTVVTVPLAGGDKVLGDVPM